MVNKYLEKEINLLESALLSGLEVADIVIFFSASVIPVFKATVNLIVPEATPSLLLVKHNHQLQYY